MEHKPNLIYQFISQTLMLFAADVLMLIIIAALFGEQTKEISTMFQFGSKGLASTTLLQFLLSSASIILLIKLFYSERIFKKAMALWRSLAMVLSSLILHILYILLFGWFSYDNSLGWIGFFVCFGGGFLAGSTAIILKTKLDSKRYDELLHIYKEQREEEDDE